MKKIIIAMAALAAAFTMASCNKEQPVSPNDNPATGKSVITASIENGLTKTYFDADGNDTDGYNVFWSEGDDLFVADYQLECWAAKYTLDNSSAGSSTGVFSWKTGDMFISATEEYGDGPVFEEGNYYLALYPFDLVGEDISPMWKTEQTYDETERYTPMYSELEGTEDGTADFTFRNLGGMLRLTAIGSSTIRSIKISAKEGESMSGPFSLMLDYSDITMAVMAGGANYIILDCGKEGVTLTEDGTDFYFSIPCLCICDEHDMVVGVDGYSDVTITLKDTEGRTCVKKLNNKKLVIERSKITTATFTASEFKDNIPEGALPGKFSVSADKQVYFSQGNLTATVDAAGTPTAWKFAAHQYDCLGENGANKTIGIAAGDVDLFGWSTEATKYGISISTDYDDYSGDFVDWGKNIGDGNTWRTLSKDEWTYLFKTSGRMVNGKPCYSNDVSGVSIGGTTYKGLFIYPDNYNGDEVSSSMTWDQINAAGIVFLPAARLRDGSFVVVVGDFGYYWSSAADGSRNAYYVNFNSDGVYPDYRGSRSYGYSVRLITESK